MGRGRRLTDEDYERLLAFRTGLRIFLKWSKDQAAAAGVAPAQHQLLLAIRGHGHEDPTIGDIADYLLLRHHSAVELVTRAQAAGLVERVGDDNDRRVVRVRLTPHGRRTLENLAAAALEELRRLQPRMKAIWTGLEEHPS